MTFSYNLIKEPWLECETESGHQTFGLLSIILHAHEIKQLHTASPLTRASLLRLLLAVIHRIFGPADYKAWLKLWTRGYFPEEPVKTYLGQWEDRFDLFDTEHPFMQCADDRVKQKPINSLVPHMAFGNKATLFDHNYDAQSAFLNPDQAASAVITAQSFGLAGLSGLKQKFTDASCSRGVIYFLQGDSLFETMVLNLLKYPTSDSEFQHSDADMPCWEMENPFHPERTLPLGYLDYLTWQNRRITLFPEYRGDKVSVREMTVAPGLRLASDVRDPMKHYYRRDQKSDLVVQRFNEARALWRDSAALLNLSQEGSGQNKFRPPRTFDWIKEIMMRQRMTGGNDVLSSKGFGRLALGMANNQAKIDFYRSELIPLPGAYLAQPELVTHLSDMLKMAEDVRSSLRTSAWIMAQFCLNPLYDAADAHKPTSDDVKPLTSQWAIERDYWVQLELPFLQAMVSLAEAEPQQQDAVMAAWVDTLRGTAWSALERIASGMEHDPRKLKAAVKGRNTLAFGLAKLFNPVEGR